jgi:hypothetical protein
MDNYLDVIRVQKILRDSANDGHDVVTNPKTVHIDGKPYGMAVGHNLSIRDYSHKPSDHDLNSYFLQSESPVLSHLSSSPKDRESQVMVPEGNMGYTFHFNNNNNEHDMYFHESKNKDGTWQPSVSQGNVKDRHESLKMHSNLDPKHWNTEKRLKNFNMQEDFAERVSPAAPFSGLIGITHYQHTGTEEGGTLKKAKYTYNPETEQLLKHKGD